jgi:CBS domain-containing protein
MYEDGALDLEARDVMTAGVVTVPDDAPLDAALDAMAEHRIHAVLVVGSKTGTPLGWVTTRGLLGLFGQEQGLPITEAITEEAKAIDPSATLRAAVYAMALPGVSRLLVGRRGESAEGVLTDYDLTVRARRLSRRPA